jgi:membrane-bound lytic murein transglycosylase B
MFIPRLKTFLTLLALLAAVLGFRWDQGALAQSGPFDALAARLSSEGLDQAELKTLFASPQLNFDPTIMARKVDRMVRQQFEPKPPPTKRTLQQSAYAQYLKPWVLAWANDYAQANRMALAEAEKRFGVPGDVVVALLLVETKLGTNLGEDLAFGVLASMAACADLASIRPYLKTLGSSEERAAYAEASAREKAEWAYQELKALMLMAKAIGQNPLDIPGSIYGAVGICQFMPSNVLKYGVKADGRGQADPFDPRDAILSTANYLVGHGWKASLDYEGQKAVIYAYNHSDLYALAVMTVAEHLRLARGAAGRP